MHDDSPCIALLGLGIQDVALGLLDDVDSVRRHDEVGSPFAETRVIHGGRQSMPLVYSNTKGAQYCERTHTFAVPQDWTKFRIISLAA